MNGLVCNHFKRMQCLQLWAVKIGEHLKPDDYNDENEFSLLHYRHH